MASLQTFDPNTAGNFEEIEMQFAVKTVEFLEVGLLLQRTKQESFFAVRFTIRLVRLSRLCVSECST